VRKEARVQAFTTGVVGAGFMCSGIAELAARAGMPVVIFEPERAPLQRSRGLLEASVQAADDRDKLDASASVPCSSESNGRRT
jgi:3-hydroxyacyl-CoA dehydrogenase